MKLIPLNKITTGCIGVCENGRKIFFYEECGVLCYTDPIRHHTTTHYRFKEYYNEEGKNIHHSLNLVQIYNPLKVTEDNILQAELLWERGVDWENVPVDTPIFVRDIEGAPWLRRHFAFYKEGKVYAFADGFTSFTSEYTSLLHTESEWNYAKLAKENE